MKRELRSYAPVVPSKTIPGLQSKMGKVYTLFQTQKAQKHYPLGGGAHTYMAYIIACSRLRDSGEKSFSKKNCEKRAGAGERQGVSPAGGESSPGFPGEKKFL